MDYVAPCKTLEDAWRRRVYLANEYNGPEGSRSQPSPATALQSTRLPAAGLVRRKLPSHCGAALTADLIENTRS